jgi:predicted DNA-binding ribbon-helix-helix protein
MNEQADTHGLSVSALLRYAVLYYLSEHEARRVAWRVPRFARSPTQADHEGRLEVSLELENRVWRSLEAESERQRVPLAQLLGHAAFFFLNDLACGGEAAQRLISREP